VDSVNHLLPQEFSFNLSHLPIGLPFKVAMQRPSVDILHNEENLLVRLEGFVQLCEAFMVDFLHNLDFSLDALAAVGFEQLELIVDLHCDLLV